MSRRKNRPEILSLPKTLSELFRARGVGLWQHHLVDEADASDGLQVETALIVPVADMLANTSG